MKTPIAVIVAPTGVGIIANEGKTLKKASFKRELNKIAIVFFSISDFALAT